MSEGRDFSHAAYQAPFIERYGLQISSLMLILGSLVWLLIAKPWEFQRAATALKPDAPVRVSTADNVMPLFTRQTQRVAIHGPAVYVTWVDSRTDPPTLLLATSTDSGKSFTEHVIEVPIPGRRLMDPALLTNSTGSLFCLYTYSSGETKRITKTAVGGKQNDANAPLNAGTTIVARLARSDDGGTTWPVISDVASVYSPSLSAPVMGIDGRDAIHLAALATTGGQEQVVVTRSLSGSGSFEPDVQVSTATKGRRRDLAIAVSPSGRVAVVWSDLRNAIDLPENGEIYGSLANAGKEFSTEIPLITPALKPGRQRYPSVILTDSGELGVLFQEGIDRERRDRTVLRYTHSKTFGQEFAPSQTLFAGQIENPADAQMVVGRPGFVYLTCVGILTDRDQPTALIAQSRNGGQTFSALTPVIDRFAPTVQSPSLAVQGNTIMLSYYDYADPDGKPGTQEIYVARIEDENVRG